MKPETEGYELQTRVMIEKIKRQKQMYPVEMHHHTKTINLIAFNSSQTLMATCSNDATINLYNGITFEYINQFKCQNAVKQICFLVKEDKLVASTGVGHVYIFDVFEFQSPLPEDNNEANFQPTSTANYLFYWDENARIFDMKVSFYDNSIGVIWQPFFASSDKREELANQLTVYSLKDFTGQLSHYKRLSKEHQEAMVLKYKRRYRNPEKSLQKFLFYIDENIVFAADKSGQVFKFEGKDGDHITLPKGSQRIFNAPISNITFSPKYEFLMASSSDGVKLVDPESLLVFRYIRSKFPVLCCQMSSLMYDLKPKHHLIFAGGIPQIEQARRAEGGNEIQIYNASNGDKIAQLAGPYGNVNWIELFKDGSGFVTAGEEGITRIYRFDRCYYEEEAFN